MRAAPSQATDATLPTGQRGTTPFTQRSELNELSIGKPPPPCLRPIGKPPPPCLRQRNEGASSDEESSDDEHPLDDDPRRLVLEVRKGAARITDELRTRLSYEDGCVLNEILALERQYVRDRRDLMNEMCATEEAVRVRARRLLKERTRDRGSGHGASHADHIMDIRSVRAELLTCPLSPDFFNKLDKLKIQTCQKLLKYGDDMCLRFKYRLGLSMTEALARYREMYREICDVGSQPGDVGSQPCDGAWGGEDLALMFAEAGFITWSKAQGRKPHNKVQLKPPDMVASLGLDEPGKAAQWFLEFLKVDADATFKDGWSPIHMACDAQWLPFQESLVTGLLECTSGEVLNKTTKGTRPAGQTPLLLMCGASNADVTTANLVRQLCAAKADIEAKDRTGNTAFLKAAGTAMTDVCRTLKKLGCNINETNEFGQNAAAVATGAGRPHGDRREGGMNSTLNYLQNELKLSPTARIKNPNVVVNRRTSMSRTRAVFKLTSDIGRW